MMSCTPLYQLDRPSAETNAPIKTARNNEPSSALPKDSSSGCGSTADDGEKNNAYESLRHTQRLTGPLGRADQNLAHPRRQHRCDDQTTDRPGHPPMLALVMVFFLAACRREKFGVSLQHEEQI